MATKTKSDDQKDYYVDWKDKHDMPSKGSKKDFKKVKKWIDRKDSARRGRQNNCYWAPHGTAEQASVENDSEATSSWEDRWPKQRKAWLGWYRTTATDDLRGNYKSPSIPGRIESMTQKFQRLDIGWAALPTAKDDMDKAEIMSIVLQNYFSRGNVKQKIVAGVKEAMIHGSAHWRVLPTKVTRKGKFLKKDMTEEDAKKGNIFGDEEEYTKYDDISIEVRPIEDIYVDPQGRTLHGLHYQARYLVDRRIMSVQEVKEMLKNNPLVKNLDKIQGKSYYVDAQYDFWQPPKDLANSDDCEVLFCESEQEDEYVVIVNDMLVLESPIPWNDKRYSYVKVDCIPVENQYYGIGIADRLLNLSGHQEVIFNMAIDKMFQSLSFRILTASSAFGEISDALMRADSSIIPIDDSDGQPIGSKVYPLTTDAIGFDFYKLFELFERDATMFTQIDPSQMALMEGGSNTATETMIHKEQMEIGLASMVDNLAHGGLLHLGEKVANLIRQEYSRPKIEKISDKEGKEDYKEIWRSIRLDGEKVVMDDSGVRVDKDDENEYSFFEIKGEYLNTSQELEIMIKPESLQVLSKGLEMQKVQEAFTQLMPLAVDPNNPMQKMNHPMPLIDAVALVERYVKVMEFGEDLLIDRTSDDEDDYLRAVDDIDRIMAGEDVPGMPGESRIHILTQMKILGDLNKELESKMMDIESSTPQLGYDMQGQPIMGDPNPQLIQEAQNLYQFIMVLERHNSTDTIPEDIWIELQGGGSQEQPMDQAAQQDPMAAAQAAPMEVPAPGQPTQQDVMGGGYAGQIA